VNLVEVVYDLDTFAIRKGEPEPNIIIVLADGSLRSKAPARDRLLTVPYGGSVLGFRADYILAMAHEYMDPSKNNTDWLTSVLMSRLTPSGAIMLFKEFM
jgi:hypothetical protein